MLTTVPISFEPASPQDYDIIIGQNILSAPETYLNPIMTRRRVVIVTDENVEKVQLPRFTQALTRAGYSFDVITLAPGESTKSLATLEFILSKLLKLGIERKDFVIALGGGVVGDITGFACSMLRRGCGFIQAPTTLLAQVDSSVGGKTAINTEHGKNLVGAFYQPRIVLTDTDTLSTLPDREKRAGYAEVVKYGLLGDADFFTWLEKNGQHVLNLEPDTLSTAISKSCQMKAAIVAEDERETGKRALLNLGHTFGHALEAAYGYRGTLLHGEGVAIGMCMAFKFAADNNMCSSAEAERVAKHLKSVGCPTRVQDLEKNTALSADNLMPLMMQDKKVTDGELTLILPEKIGSAVIVNNVPQASVHRFWTQELNA